MNDLFATFNQKISEDTGNATSSQVSQAGAVRSTSHNGRKTEKSGQVHALVSRFRALDDKKDMPTNVTSGPLFSASSPSASLQLSLANRLQERLGLNGSVECALTWKTLDMPAGVQICALRASVRRISGKEFSGAPSMNQTRGGGDMGNANLTRLEGHWRFEDEHEAQGREKPNGCSTETGVCDMLADADLQYGEECDGRTQGRFVAPQRHDASRSGVHGEIGFWEEADWIACGDGKARRTKPGISLLAHGIPNRMGRLRGFGNAIVPPLAAEFIKAVMEVAP